MITIPQNMIDAGARFILVRRGSKEAIETGWHINGYDAGASKLQQHIANGGNYGVLSGETGVCVMDIDNPNIFRETNIQLPHSFSVQRDGGASAHYYFTCKECPPDMRKKIETPWGDIRLGGNFYTCGPNCVAPSRENPEKVLKYEIFSDIPLIDLPWEIVRNIISVSLNKKIVTVSSEDVLQEQQREPLVITEKMHHEHIRRYVGNQLRLNVPLSTIQVAVADLNKKGVFERKRGDNELIREVDDAYAWHTRKQANDKEDREKQRAASAAILSGEYALTELEASNKFIDTIRGRYLYNVSTRVWHKWNGKCWGVDTRKEIVTEAKVFASELYGILETTRSDLRDATFKKIQGLNSMSGISNIIRLAESGLVVEPDEFDTDEKLLCVQNGTLVFTGDINNPFYLREHRQEDMISLITNVSYDAEAPIPEIWIKHVKTIMCGDEDLARNLQFVLGYCLCGGNPLERFVIHQGSGRNGKSVTLRHVGWTLGDYAVEISPLTIMQSGNKAASPERRLMRAKRFMLVQEPQSVDEKKDTMVLDTGFIKTVTGRDKIVARDNHANNVEAFYVKGLINLSCNPLPVVKDTSNAYWERPIIIPYLHTFDDTDRDESIDVKFKEVGAGIFNWMLQGYVLYLVDKKFKPAEAVQEMIDDARSAADEYALFMRDCIIKKRGAMVSFAEMYNAYVDWCKVTRQVPKSDKLFATDFKTRLSRKRTTRGSMFLDCELNPAGWSVCFSNS